MVHAVLIADLIDDVIFNLAIMKRYGFKLYLKGMTSKIDDEEIQIERRSTRIHDLINSRIERFHEHKICEVRKKIVSALKRLRKVEKRVTVLLLGLKSNQ